MSKYFRKSAQSGQAIVLVALMMIVMLGFVGLAIDGGRLYEIRRLSQNKNDAAVVAGEWKRCNGGNPIEAATNMAKPYTGTFTETKTDFPTGGYSTWDLTGNVPIDIPSAFAQVIGIQTLSTNSLAVARCRKPMYASSNYAVVATSKTCQNAASFSGADLTVFANIWSNHDTQFTNSPRATVNGDVYYLGSNSAPNTTFTPPDGNPALVSSAVDFPAVDVTPYAPGGIEAQRAETDGAYHYSATTIRIGNNNPNAPVTEVYGLYFAEGDIDANNVAGQATFVSRNGTVHVSGRSAQLTAYTSDGKAIVSGMTTTNCGQNAVVVSTARFTLNGDINATGGCDISDSDNSVFNGTTMCNTVHFASSDTKLYGGTGKPFGPTTVDLKQ